ncbi:MAG: hypothetical protein BWY51_00980 [Parcubacteria group bacterium ADurb.Bin316]|nr:MAG: hypothetical protein BWY51_00980 [Parcubacteria group bacterium ADurb.Bin316]HOZ56384.1 hypothetical protein [bacterium]
MSSKIHVVLVCGENPTQRDLRLHGFIEGTTNPNDGSKKLADFKQVVEILLAERLYGRYDDEMTKKDRSLHLYRRGYQSILLKVRFFDDGVLEEAVFIANDEQSFGHLREVMYHLKRTEGYTILSLSV